MSIRWQLLLSVLILVLTGCSNTRFLTDDQMLYTGRSKVEINNKDKAGKLSSVKMLVESTTNHKVNNSLFGQRVLPPIGLWVYNYSKPKKQKGFGNWYYRTFSSEPVLVSDVSPELRATKIENELFDQGYFQAKARAEIDTNIKNPKKARVSYYIDLSAPYSINDLMFDTPVDRIDTLIGEMKSKDQVRKGKQFSFSGLTEARKDISRSIRGEGYFYFTPDFIECRVDTNLGNKRLNLLFGKKQELPTELLNRYTINRISFFITRASGNINQVPDTTLFDSILIVSDGLILKPEVLTGSLYFHTGDLYSYSAYQRTINHLNNLGVFKYVNIVYELAGNDSISDQLNVRIDLLMADNVNLDFETNLVTKSNGFSGPAVLTSITHINAFKGAEKLQVKVNGGFEWQWGIKSEDQLGTYSYEVGLTSGLVIPRIIVPERFKKNKPILSKNTGINLGFNLLNRTAYYRMYSTNMNLNYQWGPTKEIHHTFYPVYLNSVRLLETTSGYDSIVAGNIYIRKSFEEQFILGLRYDFAYNNSFEIRPNNCYFQAGISTSGNVIDFFVRQGKQDEERPYSFLNNIYSQYLKIFTDFRYYRNAFNTSMVFRVYAGVGMPYGNSLALPYVEQFFSGGAYSIRGFTARYLGPGSYYEESDDFIDQSGDIKLESNLEFRFKMTKVLNGAIFLETGNIWLINIDENRPGANFNMNTFYNELAVGSGFGLRLDFSFFVLRLDFGVPIRNPYITENRNWLFGTGKIWSEGLFHLAIGYPF